MPTKFLVLVGNLVHHRFKRIPQVYSLFRLFLGWGLGNPFQIFTISGVYFILREFKRKNRNMSTKRIFVLKKNARLAIKLCLSFFFVEL